jgi:hypothetical protein
MTLFPSAPGGVQVQVIPRWPGKIVGTGGVKAETSAGTVTISSDIPSLVEVTPADNEGRFVMVWNEAADTNERVELKLLPTKSQSYNELTEVPTEFPPEAHTHPASEISDSTSVGRDVLTAASQAAARTAIDAAATSHTHTASQVTDFAEAVDDRVDALLVAGSGINITYNDGANTLTIEAPDTTTAAVAQCRVDINGGSVFLTRFDGKYITVDGDLHEIPEIGLGVLLSSLTLDVTYYLYAYINIGVLSIQASTTGHSRDSSTGVEIMTGDPGKSLVGMVRRVSGEGSFALSWFNRTPKLFRKERQGFNLSATGGAFVEIYSANRVHFLAWGDEVTEIDIEFHHTTDGGTNGVAAISIDGDTSASVGGNASYVWLLEALETGALSFGDDVHHSTHCSRLLTEGYHFANLAAFTAAGSTIYFPAITGSRTHSFVRAMG